MTIIELKQELSNLDWVKNKAPATAEFWDLYNKYKDELKDIGIYIKKLKDGWFVYSQLPLRNIVYNFNPEGLYDYQMPIVENLLQSIQNYNSGLDASSTGTGKTFSSLSIARSLNVRPLVLAPKSSLVQWKRIANDHFAIDIDVETYEKVRMGNTHWLERHTTVRSGGKKYNSFEWNSDIRMIIFDEAHKLKSSKSLNGKMAAAAYSNGIITLHLSASIAESVKDMAIVGKGLGLFTNFFTWADQYGKYVDDFGTTQFRDSQSDLLKLHHTLFPKHGQRVLQTDEAVRKHFPDNRVLPTLYTLDEARETINNLYKEIHNADERIRHLEAGVVGEGEIHPLTVKLRARQELERIKAPIIIEQAKNSISEGNSVIIFVNFLETIEYMSDKLNAKVIYGDVSAIDRAQIIDDFQHDIIHIVIVQSEAGGESISLHDAFIGKRMRETFISPVYTGRRLLQILGRAWRAGGLTPVLQRIVFIADTEEENVYETMVRKIHNIELIQDGNLATHTLELEDDNGFDDTIIEF